MNEHDDLTNKDSDENATLESYMPKIADEWTQQIAERACHISHQVNLSCNVTCCILL